MLESTYEGAGQLYIRISAFRCALTDLSLKVLRGLVAEQTEPPSSLPPPLQDVYLRFQLVYPRLSCSDSPVERVGTNL